MIRVLQPGIYSSIQDMGRVGYRKIGVPLSGSMDHISASMANALLNNKIDDAVMETTLRGPVLEFMADSNIVISGAEMSATLNDSPIMNNKVYTVKSTDILKFGRLIKGVRCYLAVKGGFQTKSILKSRSYYNGITSEPTVKKNDLIRINPSNPLLKKQFGLLKAQSPFFTTNHLDVYSGPEFDLFSDEEQEKILATTFKIMINNRMGYNFNNTIGTHSKSMITSPVLPGTVQILPTGKIIVLMKDAQTTGGYPRILQLTEKSIAILSQKRTGDKIKFNLLPFN